MVSFGEKIGNFNMVGRYKALEHTMVESRNKKKTKKDASDAIHTKLLASRSLNPSNTCNALVSVTDDKNVVTCLLGENEELKSALKTERERNNPPGEVKDYIYTLQKCLQRIEEKVEKMNDHFQKKLDSTEKVNLKKLVELQRKMANIEDSIKEI
ncbi:uncharacterized protein LOC112590436 [Harpegnathos saltator]|uniref:uncharacterized protein LOC112590436 n=1 Tax=Harpegnathos saltator TaxID=610380 RepID=UPI000DBED373|nr:uncharacterized protein LOC112590436 [Harpegnathos saltator]